VSALHSEISAPVSEKDLLPIGYLSKAHGIRGELVFVPTVESSDLVQGTLFLRHRGGGAIRPFSLLRKRTHHGSFLLSFAGVTTRNDAELLRSHTVFVSRQDVPPPEDDEVFLNDLPGLSVFALDESGAEAELGVLETVSAPAGQLLWSIRTPEGKEILFPAVEDFVLSIDLDRKRARIAPPPGLLDVYLKG
jgi:16S rRNA processing protein RimM